MLPPVGEPTGRVILLDLNSAFSANFAEGRGRRPYGTWIADAERYRQWMVPLLEREPYVLLCTARGHYYQETTLRRIAAETGWQPHDAFFNPDPKLYPAHKVKPLYLRQHIFPEYGADPSLYLAIESNGTTRRAYGLMGIASLDACRSGTWPGPRIPVERAKTSW